MFGRRRMIPGNERTVTATVCVPDQFSVAMNASLAIATNTRSPMSNGGAGQARHVGVLGYGVNRFAGRTDAKQDFRGASRPVLYPSAPTVGVGAGVSGASGMPGTGYKADSTLALMTMSQTGAGWS